MVTTSVFLCNNQLVKVTALTSTVFCGFSTLARIGDIMRDGQAGLRHPSKKVGYRTRGRGKGVRLGWARRSSPCPRSGIMGYRTEQVAEAQVGVIDTSNKLLGPIEGLSRLIH
eukprot:scaffold1350_cov137-Skeletonema_dohrnii-CCMP3373.AAC.20